ncbi:MAG: carboxypeptidase regulatory-like domain-containing protein, partial [Acidobacteriia bacterium]|nr:carboxypeptidase regulatory-like domain-containing protein [Terriglobia bacterium]
MRRTCLLFLAFLFSFSYVYAQPTGGTVRGTVTDNSGAVVPAATVSLTGNGVERSAQTQADGSYVFQGVTPGQYTV